jgi:type II restriction/modification system DNA methylase subunit YeeA
MTVWIGWLQWLKFNGFGSPQEPILRAIPANFQCRDSIMSVRDTGEVSEPEWPTVDFIVGNPPFLGGNRIRSELGDGYVENLFRLYKDRVPAFADLCCYWFEKARAHIKVGKCKRAGLLATQGIRGGANREVLKRIKDSGDIFWAISDRDWIQDGANVHVSMAAFDNGFETKRVLDGQIVSKINPDLTSSADVTSAMHLVENQSICFMGPSAKAPFDIDSEIATAMLADTGNPNGRSNSDVVRPVVSAVDIGQSSRGKWTIDFALMPLEVAAKYEKPFEYVKTVVLPSREQRRDDYRGMWWQYARPRPEMRKALVGMKRYIATPGVSKHRLFVWMTSNVLCNQGTLVFARDDDYFFGVLHSRIHEVWARAQGTQLREEESGCRYTPTTSFETFPLPRSTPEQAEAIASAARELVEQRDRWLKPENASSAELKKRTLTNLYNARPTWLDLAHKKLDAAVAEAYGLLLSFSDDEIISHLLALNLSRS